jgi:putative endonuclease
MADYFVYMMTNPSHTVLYIGMTSSLPRRIWEHVNKVTQGFTQKYRCTKFIYFEPAPDQESALYREKQLKGW